MKRFVIGDIHGAYKALKQCIKRSEINKENDLLICLGDVADGFPEVPECFNELLTFKNLVYVMGNHDYWMAYSMHSPPHIWVSQGGRATIDAYADRKEEMMEHITFLRNVPYYHLTEDNKLFVHAGYNYYVEYVLDNTTDKEFMWDREIISCAIKGDSMKRLKLDKFDEVYIGHTALRNAKVFNIHNLWNMDTGAGWSGRLSVMDIDTKEIFQSDNVLSLYPNARGR